MAVKKTHFPNSVFVDEYEKEIESAVRRNLSRLNDKKSIKKSHSKIVEILNKEKQDDNKYLDFENYKNLIFSLEEERELKRKKTEEKRKAEEEQQHTHQE